jgi:hypothetical protein
MIGGWLRLSSRRRRLLAEATVELLVARVSLLPLPGLDWQRALGRRAELLPAPPVVGAPVNRDGPTADGPVDGVPVGAPAAGALGAYDVSRDIGWAVRAAAARVPWRSVCLPQAIAAQRMLRRRGIASRAVVGARRSTSRKPIDLHVWVLVDGTAIVGGRGHATFEPVVAYDV